jgi:two-component system response regulator AtoC
MAGVELADTDLTDSCPRESPRPQALGIQWVFPVGHMHFVPADQDRRVIGRASACEVRLDGTDVSRRHAEIWKKGDRLAFRDLDSRNGVFLNGMRSADGEAVAGDILRIGQFVGVAVVRSSKQANPFDSYSTVGPGLLCGPALRPVVDAALRVAPTALPVVLVGDTGTGKEKLAQMIHAASGRSGKMVALNCAALPESLAEAELFGFRKGAFTGADRSHDGLIRQADRGTLLLDEVADLPLSVQAKLLRVIEDGRVTPLGDVAGPPVDVRLVAATQTSLATLVERDRFRSDLRARLEGMILRIPPLRERREEVPFLFLGLLAEASQGRPPQVSPRLVETLCLQEFPQNVRELNMLVRRLVALHGSEARLHTRHLQSALSEPAPRQKGNDPRVAAIEAVRRRSGNIARAARDLNMSRQQVYRLVDGMDLAALRAKARTRS